MTPTDTLYGDQWHFTLLGTGSGGELLIQRIWNEFTGAGIYVGVYDDGIEFNHFDLNDNYDANLEIEVGGITQSGNVVTTNDTHGTSVAGLIAAENNGQDTVGVAFGASLTGINIFDPSSLTAIGAGSTATTLDNFYSAIEQGAAFDVMNHSWGSFPGFSDDGNLSNPTGFAALTAAAYAFVSETGRGGLGTIVVQSAGNEAVDANGDGINASRHTLTVGALHQDGFPSSYSNYGASVLVSAAAGDFVEERGGLGIVTTDRAGAPGYDLRAAGEEDTNYTDDFGGTSASAPIVSGVVALMLDANEALGWRDVQDILALSADHTGSAIGSPGQFTELSEWQINKSNVWNGGGMHVSGDYGYGAVNVFAAVRMAEAWKLFDQPAQTSANETVRQTATLNANRAINDARTVGNNTVNGVTSYNFTLGGTALDIDHAALTLGLTHSFFTDLRVELVSAEGTVIQLVDGRSGDDTTTDVGGTWTFGIEHLRGELSAGTWTVRITDVGVGDVGVLNSVQLTVYGAATSANDVYHYTDEFDMMRDLDATRTGLADTDGGTDWINAAAVSKNITLSLVSGVASTIGADAFITVAAGTTIENIVTGDGNDNITGNTSANEIHGMRGNDTLNGGLGDDTLVGGAGGDSLNGGGGLRDVADYSGSSAAVSVSINGAGSASGGHATGDTLSFIEDLTGSAFGDTLIGNIGQNILRGGDGGDTLSSSNNNDQVFGGNGNDLLLGGAGADVIDGGADTDTVSFANAGARIVLTLSNGAGTATGSGQGAGDTITNVENITGSNFNDILTGDANANTIVGGAGNDTLSGGGGDDIISGQGGLDILNGGTGNDTLNGGTDADKFVFNIAALWNNDTINSFQNNVDKIDLVGAGFDFADFTETQSGADTLLTLTANPTHTIRLVGINAITIDATDFV